MKKRNCCISCLSVIVIFFVTVLCLCLYYGRGEYKYTITKINMQKVIIEDSSLAGKNLYVIDPEIETSVYNYGLWVNSIKPYYGGCSDSLVSLRISDVKGVDVLHSFCKVEHDEITTDVTWWYLKYENTSPRDYLSLSPDGLLMLLGGAYYDEHGERVPCDYPSLLLCLDNDSVIPDVIELHCEDKIIKGKVNNIPRKMIHVNVF